MSYFFSFVTPKGQAPATIDQRETSSTQSTSTTISPAPADRGSGSRIKRTTQLLNQSSPAKEAELHKVQGGKITKPSHKKREKRSSFFGLDRLASFFNRNKAAEDEELEGDTLVDNDNSIEATGHVDGSTLLGDGYEYTRMLHGQPSGKSFVDYRGYRNNLYDDSRLAEWTEAESWLMAKLRSRGRYPVFDRTWHYDFWWFPRRLFTSDPTQVIVNNTNANICRAIRAYDGLVRCGGFVRSQLHSGAVPERPIYRALNDYYKWSLADGGNLANKAHIPVTAIVSAKPGEDTIKAFDRLTDELHSLARQYRNKWRKSGYKESDPKQQYTHPMPTLFGFFVKYTVVAIVTLDTGMPRKPIRTVHTADWKVNKQECWNSMAVAIAFVKQRNYLMQLDKEGELGSEVHDESDPDA